MPGGRINKNEHWLAALKREIKEETGLEKFNFEKILDVNNWKDNNRALMVITYVGFIDYFPEIKLSYEHTDYAWISKKDLNQYEFWHNTLKDRIKLCFANKGR